jgi:rubrerythrin
MPLSEIRRKERGMTFEEVYQQIRKMHYEILDERESISKSARLSLSTWMLDILTEYRDEWCDDCKRFNKVIREALKREPSEDGTLKVKVDDATKVGRVLISDDEHRGGLYYPDEDEPQGDLISRAEAIYEIHDFFSELMDELPRTVDEDGEWIITDTKTANTLLVYNKMLCKRVDALPSADRHKGEWIAEEEYGDLWVCDQCGFASEHNYSFCPICGTMMTGGDDK